MIESQVSAAAPAPTVRVAVLLATYNGALWLKEQIDTILAQQGIEVRLVASDDSSTDATGEILADYEARGRLSRLPACGERMGNANRNFLRLIHDADVGNAEFVALADQDDIWLPAKLQRAAASLQATRAQAYSGDVIAFWPDGRTQLLVKSQPQRPFDHLFEAPGPGCTFVLCRAAYDIFRAWLRTNYEGARAAPVHDWLIYAFVRQQGWRWHIDPQPSMLYRQHGLNEAGANIGARAALRRGKRLASGLFRQQAVQIAALVGDDTWVSSALSRLNIADRLRLALACRSLRRRPRDALMMLMFLAVTP